MRKRNKSANKAKYLMFLFIAVHCFSCATKHYSFSNVSKKMPFKVAVLMPAHLRTRYITGDYKTLKEVDTRRTTAGGRKIGRKPKIKYINVIEQKEYPVNISDSGIESLKEGLEELFEEVEVIDEPTNLDKYYLVFMIKDISGVGERGLGEQYSGYYASIKCNITVYDPRNTYTGNFYMSERAHCSTSFARFLFDIIWGLAGIGTLGILFVVYAPFDNAVIYSHGIRKAQEKAFGNFLRRLTTDPEFVAFNKAETIRLAAKCNLVTSPSFTDQHALIPNNILDAVETGEVVCKISNNGEGAGFEVQLKITSKNSHAAIISKYDVGEIPPNETKEVRIPISADLGMKDGWEELYIETKEKRGYDAPPVKLRIQTAKLEKPELTITSVEINDGNRGLAKGNGNGIPENEETVELIAFIKNSGQGPGRKVKLSLEEINSGVEIIQNSQEIGTVNVGEIVKGKVVIRIPRTFDEKKLEYWLRVADGRRGAAEDEREFALNLSILRPVLAYNYKVKDGGAPGTSGNGNGQIENGERIALIITPRNNGTTEAKNLSLSIDPPHGISADRQRVNIGSLAQGKDAPPVEFLLSIPRTYDSRSLAIPIKLSQADFPGLDDRIDLPVRLVSPKLELASFRLNGIQGNTTVGKNQEAELEIFIKNSGELASEGLTVTLNHQAKGVVLKEENRTIRYGTLQPGGETDSLRFPLFIQQSAEVGSLPIRITVSQNNFPERTELLQLAIQEGTIQEIVVKGEKLKSSRPYISPAANFPPKIIIDSPFDGERLTEPEVTLRFRVSDDEEIRKVDILVNGIKHRRGIDLQPKSKSERRQFRDRKNIALVEGANTIQIIAYDNQNERAEERVTVHYTKELSIGRTFAIIIGIADYQHNGIRDLKYTENDALEIKNFLMSNQGGGVPNEQIRFLVGPEATAENIKSAVGDWLPVIANRRNDRVVLFFAGHGVKKRNNGYFIAYNTDPERIVGTSVKMQDITDYLYDVEAKTVIFLSDACHSGAAFEQKLAKRGDRMDGGFLINQFSGEGHITMVAAKSGQESIELPEYGHGLFTYYLLEGLKGEADKGGNGDKKVDIHELYRYVYEHVSDEATSRNFSQNPKMDSQVEGDIIMAIVP